MNERLERLREKLKEEGLDSFIVTGTDPHMSEYPADRWRSREYFSSFTGSAGTLIVREYQALLWTDSRYFIQAEKELEDVLLMKEGIDPSPEAYLKSVGARRVGVDGDSISIERFRRIGSAIAPEGKLIATDIVSSVWTGRPEMPSSSLYAVDERYASTPYLKKIAMIREVLRQKDRRWTFISSLDDIAWTLNLRASDIPCNPFFYSFLFISLSKAVLFIDTSRLGDIMLDKIEVREYESVYQDLPELARGAGFYSPTKTAAAFLDILSKPRNEEGIDITTMMKCRKAKGELDGMRKAHILDGAAFVLFRSKLTSNDGLYDEVMLSDMLERERMRMDGYIGPSFAPVSAFGPNGAIVHYSATRATSALVIGHGLLVLDTGSQFAFGTTDVTRTLVFGGEAEEDEKRDYTLVLKGHLALLRQRFPRGTRGVQLDVLAKQFLWQYGENYLHGTGHGVGFHLAVHEGPERISPALVDIPLEPGMVLSNEPGVYREGKYGIRIENLMVVKEDQETEDGQFCVFDSLTMVPYEKALIDADLLTDEEIDQINTYHKKVYYTLAPYLDSYSSEWLRLASSPIERNPIY